ncbi:NAD(P)-binding protein [Parathielavia appendiculata]|uniref:NAD(P)-binding protein n=1 Tax=Parathielavia appendiculata TaxID=2587402 RepID=A0AAN6TVF9_9PEZI|nr:NAD(P)-binding protein [Parathielavia appendiculata]
MYFSGGTGFIASHVLDCLLDFDFDVVVTVRSQEKGQRILESIDETLRKRTTFVVVDDVAKEGAFDEAVQSNPPFDFVIHTASPYRFTFDDPVRDCLDPAIKGTTGILHSIHAHALTVKRVVITSSSAAMLSPANHPKVYDESCWADITWEQAMNPHETYRASKVRVASLTRHHTLIEIPQKFAEQAAWSFITTYKPSFSLATINNTYTFGPIQRTLTSLDNLNTSNQRICDLVQGRMRAGIQPTAPVFTFVDVRDVALAHVLALTKQDAGGMRFYVVSGFFSNPRLAEIIRRRFPELAGRLPPEEEVEDDFPKDHWWFDNARSRNVLGLEYRRLEHSVVDTVESILRFESEDRGDRDWRKWRWSRLGK